MDIAAMSMILSQTKVQQQAGVSVMKMAMDAGETQINDMVQMLQQSSNALEHSVQPHLGGSIDIKV